MGMSVQRSQLTEYHVHTLGVVTGGVVSLRQVFSPPARSQIFRQSPISVTCNTFLCNIRFMFIVYVLYVIRCVLKRGAVLWAHKSPESATKAHLCCLLFLYYNYMNLYGMSDNNSIVCEMFILIQCPQPYRKLSWDMYCTRIVTYINPVIDLSKAFDTINHDILLTKLLRVLLISVLKTIQQYKKNSSYQSLKYAIPPDSILGPILFLIYVNDICNCSTLNILSFADDTIISVIIQHK